LNYEDYFELKSEFYNDRLDICIWVDDSLLLRFPDTKFYINYDFRNRLYPNNENKIILEYPKETNLYYINLRSIYFKIEIDFYYYYKLIDGNNWHVEKNLLHLKMKKDLLKFKRDNFQVFARYKIDGNKLILVDARDPDFSTMKLDSMTQILDKKN
jgi:hypothetical protein